MRKPSKLTILKVNQFPFNRAYYIADDSVFCDVVYGPDDIDCMYTDGPASQDRVFVASILTTFDKDYRFTVIRAGVTLHLSYYSICDLVCSHYQNLGRKELIFNDNF